MELGAFSISLPVKDLEASRKFYEKFGFKAFAGDASKNWLILKNGDHVIGLFQGMFDKNILTFNPGWDSNAQKLASFTDVIDCRGMSAIATCDHAPAGSRLQISCEFNTATQEPSGSRVSAPTLRFRSSDSRSPLSVNTRQPVAVPTRRRVMRSFSPSADNR